MASSEPLLHGVLQSPYSKRRGRPPKVATKLVRHARALSHEHFAFVRATLLGLDLRKSFERYIAWSEPLSDLRIAQSRFEQFLGQILDSGAKIDATLPEGQKITALLGSLRQAQRAQRKSQRALNLSPTLNPGQAFGALPSPALPDPIPTLAEWVLEQDLDTDFFSEAELLEQYEEAFGLVQSNRAFELEDETNTEDFLQFAREKQASKTPQNAPQIDTEGAGLGDAVKRHIRALNRLESLLALPPSPAHALALWLEQHPLVERVYYPGLPSHPQHALAMKQMSHVGGAVVSFDIKAANPEQARSQAFHVLDSLRVLSLCTNLGDTKTLLTHPASTSHGKLFEVQRQAAGIGQGLIRVAVGLEHVGDMQDDLLRGLDTL